MNCYSVSEEARTVTQTRGKTLTEPTTYGRPLASGQIRRDFLSGPSCRRLVIYLPFLTSRRRHFSNHPVLAPTNNFSTPCRPLDVPRRCNAPINLVEQVDPQTQKINRKEACVVSFQNSVDELFDKIVMNEQDQLAPRIGQVSSRLRHLVGQLPLLVDDWEASDIASVEASNSLRSIESITSEIGERQRQLLELLEIRVRLQRSLVETSALLQDGSEEQF